MMLKFLRKTIDWLRPGYFLYVARDSGYHNRPVIVFLHGIAATSRTWDPIIQKLNTKKYRIITLDLLGFGQSPKPQYCSYSVDDHARAVRKTLNSLGVRKVILVGHSMGSIIAVRYASKYPNSVERLFLVSPPLYLKENETGQTYLTKKETNFIIKGFEYLLKNKELTLKASRFLRQFLSVKDGAEVIKQNWRGFEQSLRNTILNQKTRYEIRQLKAPIDITYGSLDGLLVKKVIRDLAQQDNVTVTELRGKRHLITDSFAKVIVQQLDKD